MDPVKTPHSVVLALNSGSSSLKFGVYRVSARGAELLLSGAADALGSDAGRFSAEDAKGHAVADEALPDAQVAAVMRRLDRLLRDTGMPSLEMVGHRIVHGGPALREPCRIDDGVFQQLQAASVFAPLHTPAALEVLEKARAHFSDLPHVACFDTGFHRTLPAVAHVLALPKQWREQGIRRYGFHGLSCESIVRQLGDERPGKLIIAHLGNGASVTAVRNGQSVDTSMGLTPSGGLIMGTRSGDLDPGVLIYLMREQHMDATALEQLVDHQSGLLGISGLDSDMRKLHGSDSDDAHLAVQMFCYAVRKQIAAMIAVLEGVDLLVFTGGIGEHDALVREQICAGLGWAGLHLDPGRNQAGGRLLSSEASACPVQVLPSLEDEQIALHSFRVACA